MQRLTGIVLLLTGLFLAACSQTPAALPNAVAVAPTVPIADTATAEPSPTPTTTATATQTPTATITSSPTLTPTPTATPEHPLMIEVMRRQSYLGSEMTFIQQLDPGENYDRWIVSYESEGNTINGLLTRPFGAPPPTGFPLLLFNHGYIPPDEYSTTERYVEYLDYFARSGYMVFRSDYRGHGDSEGEPGGAYSEPGYTADVLNALAAVKTLPSADPERIGMWGHSMGGYITLRSMVVSDEIDAGVIWGGVVAEYPDLFARSAAIATADAATAIAGGPTGTPQPTRGPGRWRGSLISTYGSPEDNPAFWQSISSNAYLADISGPLQLHHARTDEVVPVTSSMQLQAQMEAAGMPSELYIYEDDSHDIDNNFFTAMRRSLEFLDAHVKYGD